MNSNGKESKQHRDRKVVKRVSQFDLAQMIKSTSAFGVSNRETHERRSCQKRRNATKKRSAKSDTNAIVRILLSQSPCPSHPPPPSLLMPLYLPESLLEVAGSIA